MKDTLSDRDILEAIGDEALIAAAITPHCVKQWRYRGIPWRYRSTVAKLAAKKRVKLPPNFIEFRVT
jgi:hypothetical protein